MTKENSKYPSVDGTSSSVHADSPSVNNGPAYKARAGRIMAGDTPPPAPPADPSIPSPKFMNETVKQINDALKDAGISVFCARQTKWGGEMGIYVPGNTDDYDNYARPINGDLAFHKAALQPLVDAGILEPSRGVNIEGVDRSESDAIVGLCFQFAEPAKHKGTLEDAVKLAHEKAQSLIGQQQEGAQLICKHLKIEPEKIRTISINDGRKSASKPLPHLRQLDLSAPPREGYGINEKGAAAFAELERLEKQGAVNIKWVSGGGGKTFLHIADLAKLQKLIGPSTALEGEAQGLPTGKRAR